MLPVFSLTFSSQDWNKIFQVVEGAPYREVAAIVQSAQAQIVALNAAADKPAEPTSVDAPE